ncbi:MFS transporter [Roseobacter sp.]|uniref:MFS transporter n=1 Tax=Roseobacter sp. TaxID=1907202 RepID=UPI00329A4563
MMFHRFIQVFMPACFLQSATYGLTFLLPDLVASIGGTTGDVGAVLGGSALVTLVVVLFLGALTKRAGFMLPLAGSGVVCAASLALFATASSVGAQIYIAGALLGLGWGVFYVLGPITLAQVLTSDRRVVYFTWMSTFVIAGIGVGPVIGYVIGVPQAFWFVAVSCLVCAAIFAALRPSMAGLRVTKADVESDLSLRTGLQVLRSPAWRPIVMVGLGGAVFAAISNFQTVYADANGQSYALFFLAYTVTVIVGRLAMARMISAWVPYGVIAGLMGVMTLAVGVLSLQSTHLTLYLLASVLFGVGYGVAYPIVKAMAANDARPDLTAATLQMFGLSYFVGIFGFPFLAGEVIDAAGFGVLLIIAVILSMMEGALAYTRWRRDTRAA